jgi:hypothetical protein
MTRTRYAIATVMVAVLATATVWLYFFRDDGTPSGARSDANSASATSQPAITGSDPATATTGDKPPALLNDSEDWDKVVRSIAAYRHWLYTHPNPDLLTNIEVPSYAGFADDQLGLRNLATKGWRYDPPRQPLPIDLVRFNRRDADNVVLVFVRFGTTPPIRVVDAAGKVVQESPSAPPTAALWTLVREPATDTRWRLFKVNPLANTQQPA